MSRINARSEKKIIDDVFPISSIIIFVFLTVLSCAYIPCALLSFGDGTAPLHFSIPAFLIIGGTVALLFMTVKHFGYSVSITMIMFFLYSYTRSPILPALFAAVILVFTLGGYVSSLCKEKYHILLAFIPTLSYIGAYALTGDPLLSLIALIPAPAFITMGIMQKKRSSRTSIIAGTSAALIAMVCGFLALVFYLQGRLSVASITGMIDSLRDNVIFFMKNLTVDVGGTPTNIFVTEYVDMFVTHAFNMLPSIIICTAFVIIYICHSIQLIIYKHTDFDLMVTEITSKITMSIYAACIFVVSYILSLSTDAAGNPDMLSAITGNLCIILTPGLFLMGFTAVRAILKKFRGWGFVIIMLLLICVFALSDFIIQIFAGLGAFYIIITSIDKWAQRHYAEKHK